LISENGMSETPSGQATDAIRHADILIIGGGLSGAMLAAQLLRLPASVGCW
jgi:cation diffusion facilitator CzcD-associated flavoprotein CzcO